MRIVYAYMHIYICIRTHILYVYIHICMYYVCIYACTYVHIEVTELERACAFYMNIIHTLFVLFWTRFLVEYRVSQRLNNPVDFAIRFAGSTMQYHLRPGSVRLTINTGTVG